MNKLKDASTLRQKLTKYDIDSGYVCKLFKDQIVRDIIEKEPGTILDIGCDNAYMLELIRHSNVTNEYLGIDIRSTGANKTVKEFKNATFNKVSNTFQFLSKLADSSYDYVLLLDVIEHMDNKEDGIKLYKEAIRVARKRVLMSTPNYGAENKINWPEYHSYEFDLLELTNFLASANYHNYEIIGWSMSNNLFRKIKKNSNNKIYNILPEKISRSIAALENPKQSRDILINLKK